jgi:hypothetical protein
MSIYRIFTIKAKTLASSKTNKGFQEFDSDLGRVGVMNRYLQFKLVGF